jgi:hypothetical protein
MLGFCEVYYLSTSTSKANTSKSVIGGPMIALGHENLSIFMELDIQPTRPAMNNAAKA